MNVLMTLKRVVFGFMNYSFMHVHVMRRERAEWVSFQRESEVTVIGKRLLVSWENHENRCESTKAFFHVEGVRSERRNFSWFSFREWKNYRNFLSFHLDLFCSFLFCLCSDFSYIFPFFLSFMNVYNVYNSGDSWNALNVSLLLERKHEKLEKKSLHSAQCLVLFETLNISMGKRKDDRQRH